MYTVKKQGQKMGGGMMVIIMYVWVEWLDGVIEKYGECMNTRW